MREKIKKDILALYREKNIDSDYKLEEITDVIIDKTTEALLEKIINELENEFKSGNLKQPLTISDEYYLHLKFKDIKNKFLIKPNKKILNPIEDIEKERL